MVIRQETLDAGAVLGNVRAIGERFAAARRERQARRELDPRDFDALREAGFHLTALPHERGGLWEGAARSTRPIAEMLRTLARGDASVALVASMHPSVLSYWLVLPELAGSHDGAWRKQSDAIFDAVRDGAWWGTITSEPGSGGDIAKTRARAGRDADGGYRLTGQKHFGSGSGVTSYMVTTALPDGETDPDIFYLDMRGVPWDGSKGVTLTAPWDGRGMIATQSHAMAFQEFPATRIAWTGNLPRIAEATGAFIAAAFTAVIVGVADAAYEAAREQVAKRRDALRAYERVEWARAEMDAWLIAQAYEGLLRAIENGEGRVTAVRAKVAIADLAESLLRRISRVIGGGTFSGGSPFAHWFEDVRALGFLRPPWGLAYDNLFEWSLPPDPEKPS